MIIPIIATSSFTIIVFRDPFHITENCDDCGHHDNRYSMQKERDEREEERRKKEIEREKLIRDRRQRQGETESKMTVRRDIRPKTEGEIRGK
jgi:hypothetical protein